MGVIRGWIKRACAMRLGSARAGGEAPWWGSSPPPPPTHLQLSWKFNSMIILCAVNSMAIKEIKNNIFMTFLKRTSYVRAAEEVVREVHQKGWHPSLRLLDLLESAP